MSELINLSDGIIFIDNNALIKYHIIMIKIMFVCHGNICRSPMAEFVLKDMVKRRGLEKDFVIASSATSTEEIWNGVGNPVYPPAKAVLKITALTQAVKEPFSLKQATMINTICLLVWTVPIYAI